MNVIYDMKFSIYKLFTSSCYKPLNTACHTLVYPNSSK